MSDIVNRGVGSDGTKVAFSTSLREIYVINMNGGLPCENLPDLILLDMMLPKMSGPDVLKALKNEPVTAAIPVVVLTGLSQTNAQRLLRDGASAFLAKADLVLDQGAEPLLAALRKIVKELPKASAIQSRK